MRLTLPIATMFVVTAVSAAAQDNAPPVRSVPPPVRIVPIPPPAPPRPSASPPQPVTNPGSWVGTDDYPGWAAEYEVDGRVRFGVDVDATGRVTGCEILASSGVEDLDRVACKKVSERARFRPARDERGTAVAGRWVGWVSWQLPEKEHERLPLAGELVFGVVVERDGSVSECVVERSEGSAAMAEEDICEDPGLFEPYRGKDGTPQRVRVRTTMRIEHEVLE